VDLKVTNINANLARILWIIGGGFIAASVGWVIGGGLGR
jgi:hypothetical protein